MKKVFALCAAMMMAMAILAGCSSADVSSNETIFVSDPTPMNGSSAVVEMVELA